VLEADVRIVFFCGRRGEQQQLGLRRGSLRAAHQLLADALTLVRHTYRQIGQEMHRLIAEEAGHRAIAETMSYVDHTTYELERLAAERAAEARRAPGAV